MLKPGQRCIIVPAKLMDPKLVRHLGKIVTTARVLKVLRDGLIG